MNEQATRFNLQIQGYWNRLDRSGKILLSAIGVMIPMVLILGVLPERKEKLPPVQEVIIPVQVISVTAEDRPDIMILPGLVLAGIDAKLAAEKSGRIVSINADRGQSVTNGQILLRLDDRAAQAVTDAARATFSDAVRDLERFEKLSGTGSVSQKALDDVRQAHALADAQLREAEANLSYCKVKSPINGVVNERYVEEGEYVLPSVPVFDVLSVDPVRISVDIPERNSSSLNIGDTLDFEVISQPGQIFTGTVAYISAKANADNNAFRMELRMPNPNNLLRPGMIAAVQFRRSIRTNSITLPLEAIIPQKGDHVVYLVRNDHAVRKQVIIDAILKQEAIILTGVNPGDQVVTRGNRMLTDGARVKIQE
ncbi:MAG: efflux RND transporter periplasmic adaptor subunit [Kiritimatiellaceae bacterium]|nr:efflux RND transporter periplasmic adaptor subunit [Kiritimatiellaceae bacterium]